MIASMTGEAINRILFLVVFISMFPGQHSKQIVYILRKCLPVVKIVHLGNGKVRCRATVDIIERAVLKYADPLESGYLYHGSACCRHIMDIT